MFKDEADARAVIQRYCIDKAETPIKSSDIDMLVKRLRPQIWISPGAGSEPSRFRTRLGGGPDFAEGAAWPIRTASSLGGVAEKLTKDFGSGVNFANYLARDVPFEFLAQVDLEEAALLPDHANGMPTTGRLLFFWDDIAGTYAGGAHACRVILDETPREQLAEAAIPTVFTELEDAWRSAQYAEVKEAAARSIKFLPDSLKLMRDAGIGENDIAAAEKAIRDQATNPPAFDPNLKKPFVYPRRQMLLTPIWQVPHTHTVEHVLDSELAAFSKAGAGHECFMVLNSNDAGSYDRTDWLANESRRNRFLGLPDPEQDDPRFDVSPSALDADGNWSEALLLRSAAVASDWRMLLQVAMADLSQTNREGTVHFIIRNDDLARRDFSQVHAYYQQT